MKKYMLLFVLVLISVSFIFAAQPLPHAFEGQIFSDDGSSSNGKTLFAELNGAITGQTIINGDSFKITVIDNMAFGGEIKFYIGSEQSKEEFVFGPFEVTKTDLNFKTIPSQTVGSCGDGICDANVNECSFCAIDCLVSACLGNGACDSAIGEDLVTAPNDCAVCGDGICSSIENQNSCSTDCGNPPSSNPSPSPSKSSSSSSSSSGGITGYVSSGENETNVTANSTDHMPTGISINDLNKQENVTNNNRKGISGWSIFNREDSDENKKNSWIWILVLLAIVYLALIKYKQHKKKEFEKKLKQSLKKSKKPKPKFKKAPPRKVPAKK